MNKLEKFVSEFNFEKNVIFDWNPGVWKTFVMQKLFDKLPTNEEKKEYFKYWIDDWRVKEYINASNFSLKNPGVDNTNNFLKYPLEMCIRSRILFFDDLWSSSNVSEAQKTKLKFILDEREKKWFVTIFSTNVTPKKMQELYWERIKSRIYNWKSKKWLILINIPGEDKRKENIETMEL